MSEEVEQTIEPVTRETTEGLEPDPTIAIDPEAILHAIPEKVRQYLLGQVQEQPPELAQTMDSVAEKLNMGIAFLITQRLASMSRSFAYLQTLEEALFNPERVKGLDAKQRMADFRTITKESNEFMEFVRKFTSQNQELFNRKSQADELANLLRELDPEVISFLLKLLGKKGAGTTINDLIRRMGAQQAQAPSPKPTPPEQAPRGQKLFDQLMDGGEPK